MATKRRAAANKRKSPGSRKGPVVRKAAASRNSPSSTKLQAELARLSKQFDALAKKATVAQVGARAQYQKQLKALKVKQAAAQKALERFGRQTAAAGGPLKAGLRKAWKDIDSAVRQATRRFRETN